MLAPACTFLTAGGECRREAARAPRVDRERPPPDGAAVPPFQPVICDVAEYVPQAVGDAITARGPAEEVQLEVGERQLRVVVEAVVTWPVARVEVDPAGELQEDPVGLGHDVDREQRAEWVLVLLSQVDRARERVAHQWRVDFCRADRGRGRATRLYRMSSPISPCVPAWRPSADEGEIENPCGGVDDRIPEVGFSDPIRIGRSAACSRRRRYRSANRRRRYPAGRDMDGSSRPGAPVIAGDICGGC